MTTADELRRLERAKDREGNFLFVRWTKNNEVGAMLGLDTGKDPEEVIVRPLNSGPAQASWPIEEVEIEP